MSTKSKWKIPDQICPYCAIKGEVVKMRQVYPSSRIGQEITPWSKGGYACPCCGLQTPREVFEVLIDLIPLVRVKRDDTDDGRNTD